MLLVSYLYIYSFVMFNYPWKILQNNEEDQKKKMKEIKMAAVGTSGDRAMSSNLLCNYGDLGRR